MNILDLKFACMYRKTGAVTITEMKALDEPDRETLVDVQISIDDNGIAHIQATKKRTTALWESVHFYGKNRKEKLIEYCKENGIEPNDALKRAHEYKGWFRWFRKYLWLGYGCYFTGKEEPVNFYTSNYIINIK